MKPDDVQNNLKWITDYGVAYVFLAIGAAFVVAWLTWWFGHMRWYKKETAKRDLLRQDKDLVLRDTLTETTIKNSRAQEKSAAALEEVADCTKEMRVTNSLICSHLAQQGRMFEYGHEIAELLLKDHPLKHDIQPKLDKIKANIESARNRLT